MHQFLNLFLEWNSTCFRQFLCPSSGVLHCTHSNGICHTGLQAVSKPVWHIPLLCVQWKTPDDGQRNCSKHVEFHSKNKFEKLMHLVGFIIILEIGFHSCECSESGPVGCDTMYTCRWITGSTLEMKAGWRP